SVANVRNGSYPLARYLYIYINKAPQRPLEPLTAAFLDRVLSAQGQALVNQDGYLPLSPETLRKTRLELGLK
ncbi:PstS family phosphate ABC transporter substrate-binding protein, partial [Serratia rubidaea]|nr:phosphate ABC transporter substrate-binding protein [Serratia rubidaea]